MKIGDYNKLRIIKELDFGLYLDGGDGKEILLPKRYVPETYAIDEEIEVFIYFDSEDRLIATTEKPYIKVGDFAFLKVISVNDIGAFLDWGLMKDLLVPFSEQRHKLRMGERCVVYAYIDTETGRIVASARVDRFTNKEAPDYSENQEVSLLVYEQTDLGYNAIINNQFKGVIYKNEVFQKISEGDTIKGYIKKVREDKKIDLYLHKPGFEKIDALEDIILEKLKKYGGFLEVNDKTEAEIIYNLFGASKKTFKKSIGALFKKKLIIIEEEGIRLLNG